MKKQTQFKPNQSQFQGPKMLEFTLDVSSLAFLSGAWIRSFTMIFEMPLADFITLMGAKTNPI
jgi:hypothetical protein